jgi:hypothetical protein
LLYLGQVGHQPHRKRKSKEIVMKTQFNRNTLVAAFAAVAIVGLTGLTLDRGAGGLPEGTIEVGELQTLAVGGTLYAQLPAVEVVGARVVQLADAADHAEPQG